MSYFNDDNPIFFWSKTFMKNGMTLRLIFKLEFLRILLKIGVFNFEYFFKNNSYYEDLSNFQFVLSHIDSI